VVEILRIIPPWSTLSTAEHAEKRGESYKIISDKIIMKQNYFSKQTGSPWASQFQQRGQELKRRYSITLLIQED
jgi:hypothetical protein